MDLGLRDKVVLVTGSYRGTGSGIAAVFAAEGAHVLVHAFDAGQGDDVVANLRADGGHADLVTGDIRTVEGTSALVASVSGIVPRVDVLVNNYGVAEGTTWTTGDTESWHDSYDKNVVSAVRVTQAFLPAMRAAGWGRVLFLSTVGATRPGTRIPEYYAAKGALPSIAVGLAKELAGTGITVNCISPGVIATAEILEQFRRRAERDGLGTDRASIDRLILDTAMPNPSGRVATPTDVGRFVTFVASEPAWHLNGTHLRFDGGAADTVT
jgi:3-oxoacyl-[acyl-carrier protein] reductase